jgi:sugar/nucleoside kinase (ribokinase family)
MVLVKMLAEGRQPNTVYAASILGSKCSFIGKVADDVNGNFYVDNLNKANIKNKCMSSDQGVSGNCPCHGKS